MPRTEYLIEPSGWPCTLADCPPGHFMVGDSLCFKSEYTEDGKIEAYNEAGEYFWGGVKTHDERPGVMVQPVLLVKREAE